MSWLDELQPASWRGIPFAVVDSEIRRGRRVVLHEYPFRDEVWVEDMGLGVRRYAFRGFYVGDDCYGVEQAMIAAAETPGIGELVHPSLGSLGLTLMDFGVAQRRELGRVVEFTFAFLEAAPQQDFPGGDEATQDGVMDAADDGDGAAQGDFFDQAWGALQSGAQVVGAVASTVGAVVATGEGIVSDASRLVGSVAGLGALCGAGFSLGRYAGRGLGPLGAAPGFPLGGILATAAQGASTVARVELGASLAINSAVQLGAGVVAAGEGLAGLAEGL